MLKYIYKFGQFLVYASLFLPLFVHSNFVFPFITPRNYAFRLIATLGVAVIVVLWLYYKELRPKKSWLHFAVIAVILAKVLSGFFGENVYNSFWSGYERMEGIVTWLYLGVYYFLIVAVFRTKAEWIWLFRISLLPAAYVAIYGVLQFLGVGTELVARQARIESTLGNAAYVGAYMVIHMGIATYLIFRDPYKWVRWLSGVSLVLSMIAMALSETRGSAIGLYVGLIAALLIIVCISHENQKKQRNIAAGIFVVIIALSAFLWLARDSVFVQNIGVLRRITSISITDGTANSRLQIWKLAAKGWQEKPIFGWGQENFHLIFNKYYSVDIGEEWVDRAHNNLLDQLSMNGLVGFLAYLTLIAFPFYAFWQYRRKDTLVAGLLLGLWTAYVVQNQFVFDSLNTYIPFFILLGFSREIFRESRDDATPTAFAKTNYRPSDAPWIFIGTLAISVIITFAINLPGYKANLATIQGLARINALPQQSYEYLREAVEYNSHGNKEIVMQLQLALNSYLQGNKLSEEFKRETVVFTLNASEDVLAKHPNDARFISFAANINRIARVLNPQYLETALAQMRHATSLSPQRPDMYLQLGELLELAGNTQEAKQAYQTGYDVAPTRYKVAEVYMKKMVALEEFEKAKEAAHRIERELWENLNDDRRAVIGSVYISAADWEKAVNVFEQLVNDNPNNGTYWELLADAYEGAGRLDEAAQIRAEIERVKAAQ